MATTLTFLAAVNATLKRVQMIEGASGELTTFTDSARQTSVDIMLDVWNEVLDELFKLSEDFEGEIAESSFTLVADKIDYSLATDYVRMIGNPVEPTNVYVLTPYPGGYKQLRIDQPDRTDFTGSPRHWVVSPLDGDLEIDSTPTSEEAGDIYTYMYEKGIDLAATGDTFPFDDEIVRSLYAAVAQAWSRERNQQFDEGIYLASMARAAQKLRNTPTPNQYGVRRAAGRR